MSQPESDFKAQFGSWASRTASQSGASSAPAFSDWSDYVRSGANNLYDSLPSYNTSGAAAQEPSWFQLSRFERVVAFGCCLGASLLCFTLGFFVFPVLALRPTKFAVLWLMGLLLFVVSFGVLQGPNAYIRHITSSGRILFSAVFFGLILTTMYCAVVLKSTVLTIVASVVEVFAILYYAFSYFPFGTATITWFSSYVVGYVGGLFAGLL
ncbi:SFT2-domain-containing protein [Metschnikowia bicuspidata var. bicuspidata NRRL YB-4993]|uniref:Protein transport protein SFT2 n=1 Tax=Metschnikowia bicuspidata var. bicuspidata NRRL YB-4993 TaxID=869754 RepID=A0A1A0HCG8_9ASCO|nr:SFT2-domain-containing protein [Metschnikowia bicuspidata var. bicuspidata NRRL YB-4993]OBA21582.1 SFT2-domain-containing protein [Metschnikowia bicuspidata var. bicuspidata NRRL YB-4993]